MPSQEPPLLLCSAVAESTVALGAHFGSSGWHAHTLQHSTMPKRHPSYSCFQGKLRPHHLDKPWGALWQDNMQQRDFTVNAMMYNPFSHLLFDYVGGLADCNKRRLQCCLDPSQSFQEDPVRMLRAVRLAARCGKQLFCPCGSSHNSPKY